MTVLPYINLQKHDSNKAYLVTFLTGLKCHCMKPFRILRFDCVLSLYYLSKSIIVHEKEKNHNFQMSDFNTGYTSH